VNLLLSVLPAAFIACGRQKIFAARMQRLN
jgi:hypothetical protein